MAAYKLVIGSAGLLPIGQDLAFTVTTIPSSISAGSFATITSKVLSEGGLFANHMGAVCMPDHDGVWFFGNETHSDVNGYINSVYHLDLQTGKVYRDYAASTFLGEYLIDANGIPWANSAKTLPWGQHAFNQIPRVSADEFALVYPTLSHANFFFGAPPTYTPTYEGSFTVSTYKQALWYYNVTTGTWRVDSNSAASSNTAGIMGTGYGVAYLPSRGTFAGAIGGNWRELNATTYSRESSAPAITGGNYNSFTFELPDGRLIVNAGGVDANTTVFSIVDPANPSAFVNVSKPGSLSSYSFMDTAWVLTNAGNVLGFVKDQTANQLRAVYYNPTNDTWTDTGHTLSVGSEGVDNSRYWMSTAYAASYNVVVLACNIGSRIIYGYKPGSGV